MVSTGRIFIHRLNRQCGGGVSVMRDTSKLCNVRAYSQYAFGLPYLNCTEHSFWNINRGQGGVNGSARKAGKFNPEWTTYSSTFVLRGVSAMVSTGRIYRHRVKRQCGGGFLSCGLPASYAMSGLTVSMHLVYPSWIPQDMLFEILREAMAGWRVSPQGWPVHSRVNYVLPHICFEGGFRHGKYWQNLHTQA